jgi:hypothetical protein
MPVFRITAQGDPQRTGTRWTAQADGPMDAAFLVGQSVSYNDGDGAHRGLYQTRVVKEIPALWYDRHEAAGQVGLWAHFIWPTVMAEGGGHHLTVNTYDRARFTFGFYQLAAHTPDANLILLFRALLTLPGARDYFPDLVLKNGRVHRIDGTTLHSLETVTNVRRPNGKFEDQLVGFMTYLNPDTQQVNEAEALNAARLMHWLLHDPAAVSLSVQVALDILRGRVKAQAKAFGLRGRDPRLAIWVSDIQHQGRGKAAEINAALAEAGLDAQLAALAAIGRQAYAARIQTLERCIATLDRERVFAGVKLGDPALKP